MKNNIFAFTEIEKISKKSVETYSKAHSNEILILRTKLMELFNKYF